RPKPALSDEPACRHLIDGPHRIADLALHRVPRLDRALKRLHRRDRCGRKEPAYLRVAEHRDPRVGVPVFEGANDQARRLEPDAHEADRKPPPRSVVGCTKDPRDWDVTPDCESVAFSLRNAYCQNTHMNYAGVGTVIC